MTPKNDCLFCGIAAKKIPATFVSESADWVSFADVAPQAPVHILVIPKTHIENADHLRPAHKDLIAGLMLEAARVAREKNLDKSGYRLVLNCNREGGQTVPHLHIHILGGRRMNWPPG